MVNVFLEAMVSRFGICFATPEETIIKQDEEKFDIYFISQGDCAVNIRDRFRKEIIAYKLLNEGDHFGDIGAFF